MSTVADGVFPSRVAEANRCAALNDDRGATGGRGRRAPGDIEPRHALGLRYASTASVAADCQFAFWQSLSLVPRIERTHAADRHAGFRGEVLYSDPRPDLQFFHRSTDALTWHFGWREPEYVVVAYVRHGSLHLLHRDDPVTAIGPHSGLVLCDRDRPIDFATPGFISMTYLRLSRAMVAEALGAAPIGSGHSMRQFCQRGAVISALRCQLDAMICGSPRTGGMDCAARLALVRSTTMTLLAEQNPRRRRLPETYDDALLATARCLLDLHSADFDLTPQRLAAMLHCSRAHLYRQFARAGQTIAETLKEARLQRARHLLATRSNVPIGAIAARCGYRNLSAFDRAFRARFAITPRDFQRQVPVR